jgi:hypothetical protein
LPIWLSCENQLLLPLMPLTDIFCSFQDGYRQAALADKKMLAMALASYRPPGEELTGAGRTASLSFVNSASAGS